MKYYVFLIVTAALLFSCATENNERENNESNKVEDPNAEEKNITSDGAKEDIVNVFGTDFPQKWKLVEMSTMMVNSQTSGDNMPYQEFYVFNEDQSFIKKRHIDNDSLQAEGNYRLIETEAGEKMLELTYTKRDDLVENCSGNNIEFLSITSEKNLRGTANACDHASKLYKPED